jgi:hypothetical protein
LIAPLLLANSCTCRLFVMMEVSRWQENLRTYALSCENIKLSSSVMPPIRHKLRLFLGCSSAKSVSSSRSVTISSSEGLGHIVASSFPSSGAATAAADHCFSCVMSSVSRSASLN